MCVWGGGGRAFESLCSQSLGRAGVNHLCVCMRRLCFASPSFIYDCTFSVSGNSHCNNHTSYGLSSCCHCREPLRAHLEIMELRNSKVIVMIIIVIIERLK